MIFDGVLVVEPSLTALFGRSEDSFIWKNVKLISDSIPILLLKFNSKIIKMLLDYLIKKFCLLFRPEHLLRAPYQELSLIVEEIERITLKYLCK